MKMFEPENEIPWVGLTLAEEKLLATRLLEYMSDHSLSPSHDTILHSRIDTGIIRAEDFVALLESLSETVDGLPEIEWNDECEENTRDDVSLLVDRLWVWKTIWDNWTKDHFGEFPGNDLLLKIDQTRFTDHEIERATEKEMIFWELIDQNIMAHPDLSSDDIEQMTKDQSPRGDDVIPECLREEWDSMKTAIIEEITG